MTTTIYLGDCRAAMRQMAAGSVHCVVTSPPYFGLRDYGVEGQLGLERVPDCLGWATGDECGECYVCHLVEVFREVRRVLRDDGTVWLNLGDSYNSRGGHTNLESVSRAGRANRVERQKMKGSRVPGLKPKDLMLVPHRVALALQADGWWVRSDVVWAKSNALPESVTDRPTRAHEYVFLLTKSRRYFYDHVAIREPNSPTTGRYGASNGTATAAAQAATGGAHGQSSAFTSHLSKEEFYERYYTQGRNRRSVWTADEPDELPMPSARDNFRRERSKRAAVIPGQRVGTHRPGRKDTIPDGMRNARSVWRIATRPFPDAHFAVFPEELVEPCVLAGTSAGGCCATCGAPYQRVTGQPVPTDGRGRGNVERKVATEGERAQLNTHLGSSVPWSPTAVPTVGWEPMCRHNTGGVPAVVLDPFGGSGTVALVAERLGRDAVLCELNPEYAAMAERRIRETAPLLARVEIVTVKE